MADETKAQEGDEPQGPPTIPDVPEDLSGLDEDAVRSLHSELQAAYDARRPEARTQAHVEELQGIREAQKRLAGHIRSSRETDRNLSTMDEADVSLPESAPAPEGGDDIAPEAEGGESGGELVGAGVGGDAAGAADAATAAADLTNGGNPAPPARPERPRVPMRAAAGQQIVPAGQDLTMANLARVASDTVQALRPGPDGRPVKAYIASVPAFEDNPELNIEPLSNLHGAQRNSDLMHEAVESWKARLPEEYGGTPNPATAAICEPFDIIREIPDCVTAAEPFADSLPGRPAGRLAFQFMPSASLADAAAGVTLWDETDQAAVVPETPATWKPCVFIECPSVEDVTAEAVSACVYFDITTEMSSPERVEDIMRKVAAVKARVKEQRLMQIAATFSHHFSFQATYGTVPGSIEAVLTTLEQGWAAERLDDATLYQWYVPKELVSAWVIDLAGRAFDAQDPASVTSYIEGKFRAAGKNVRIIELLDASSFPALPAVGGAPHVLQEGIRTAAYETLLLPPEGMLYFSTGEITTGVERSPELMRRNQSQWFMEEFMGLAKHGCQPWYALDLDVCENGTRAALTEPFVCAGEAT